MAGASVYSVVCFLAFCLATGLAIDCYRCTSFNGEDESCEDPFKQDLSTTHHIARDCQYGYFSGTHCIKLKGIKEDGTHILVRSCSDADWGKNCGDIRYIFSKEQEERIQGCLTTCNYDGCNAAPASLRPAKIVVVVVLFLALWVGAEAVDRAL